MAQENSLVVFKMQVPFNKVSLSLLVHIKRQVKNYLSTSPKSFPELQSTLKAIKKAYPDVIVFLSLDAMLIFILDVQNNFLVD